MLPNRFPSCIQAQVVIFLSSSVFPICAHAAEAQTRTGSPNVSLSASPSTAPSVVSGQVLNAVTGAPVARVLVRLNERAVLTDHGGKFQFDQLPEAGTNVQVIKPGFYLSTDPSEPPVLFFQPAQLSKPLVVRLYPEALLTGTVTDAQGEPLPQISVTARRSLFDEMGRRWIPAAQSQTDSHGNFRLTVPAGDYRLETGYTTLQGRNSQVVLPVIIPAESKAETPNTLRIHSGEEQHFDLHPVIASAYTVTARFESPSERGSPGVTARSSGGVVIPVSFQRNTTPDEGRLQLPAGTYTLTASILTPDGGAQAETTVTVPDHDVSGVVLRLAPNPSIPIELLVDPSATSDKSPPSVQQFGLMLQPIQSDSDRSGVVGVATGHNRTPSFHVAPGRYRLQSRNNGEWYVKSASYGTSDLLRQDLVVGSGAEDRPVSITVSNQTGSLQGVVRLNGVPSACWIYLIPNFPTTDPFVTFRSGPNGGYNVPYLPPGSYRAIAFERRHSADYRNLDTLTPFDSYVRSATINPGDKATVDLDAVSAAEQLP